MFLTMPLLVTISVLVVATLFMAMVLYGLMRRFDRRLPKNLAVIIAFFGAPLVIVGGAKTNSPPARAIHNLVSGIVGAFTEGYPYNRETWPFDEATEAAVAGRATTEVPPIPDDMTATSVAPSFTQKESKNEGFILSAIGHIRAVRTKCAYRDLLSPAIYQCHSAELRQRNLGVN